MVGLETRRVDLERIASSYTLPMSGICSLGRRVMATTRTRFPLLGSWIDVARRHCAASEREFRRIHRQLSTLPRHTPGVITIFGKPTRYVDAATFIQMYRDAFVDCSNDFACESTNPIILDCGSNIGLTVLRFKQLYPRSRITAFEPDAQIFECLRENVTSWGLHGVDVVRAAIWTNADGIPFAADGSTGGRISESSGERVPTVRLRDRLVERVDFLKLDIEGAEADVVPDCGERLANVDAMIIEWHFRTAQSQRLGRSLDVLAASGHRYFVHDCWPVEVNRRWQWPEGTMEQILSIHSRLSRNPPGAVMAAS